MRQPNTGCNAPAAIVTAAAQFVAIGDVRSRTCALKPIDFSYSLGYHVSALSPTAKTTQTLGNMSRTVRRPDSATLSLMLQWGCIGGADCARLHMQPNLQHLSRCICLHSCGVMQLHAYQFGGKSRHVSVYSCSVGKLCTANLMSVALLGP